VPFTAAHPAAILPLRRTGLPTAALVVGSVVPDLPMYVPMPFNIALTHSIVGAVTADVCAGLVLLGAWRLVSAPVTATYAPPGLRRRLPLLAAGKPAKPPHIAVRTVTLLAAIGVGALTHVGWDAFTHADLWGVRHVRWLATTVGPLPAYEWAQYVSGLVGLLLIARSVSDWWRRTPPGELAPTTPMRIGPRMAWTVAATAITIGAAHGTWHGAQQPDTIRAIAFFAATRGVDAGILAVLTVAAVNWLHRPPPVVGPADSAMEPTARPAS
jgi:hypothetical protein